MAKMEKKKINRQVSVQRHKPTPKILSLWNLEDWRIIVRSVGSDFMMYLNCLFLFADVSISDYYYTLWQTLNLARTHPCSTMFLSGSNSFWNNSNDSETTYTFSASLFSAIEEGYIEDRRKKLIDTMNHLRMPTDLVTIIYEYTKIANDWFMISYQLILSDMNLSVSSSMQFSAQTCSRMLPLE
jgi:hypothetical protein